MVQEHDLTIWHDDHLVGSRLVNLASIRRDVADVGIG